MMLVSIRKGALAQLGERLPCTQEVSGSIPLGSTKRPDALLNGFSPSELGVVTFRLASDRLGATTSPTVNRCSPQSQAYHCPRR